MCLQEGFLYGVENETERNWHKLVIKPETSKRNHRNKWNHRNDENETRSPDQKLAWKKKQSMIIKWMPFVTFQLWSTPDLTHGRSFSRLPCCSGVFWSGDFVFVFSVVSLVSFRSFRFAVSGFSEATLYMLAKFVSILNIILTSR